MATIPLTKGFSATIDDRDWDLVSSYGWHPLVKPGRVYAVTTIYDPKRTVFMHRLIAGATRGQQVDHRDGNPLNNRRSNLRVTTSTGNNANRRKLPTCKSGFKGVYREKWGQRPWRASIGGESGSVPIGWYSTPEDAARAYDAAARERWDEFCCVNFPRPGERSALTGEIVPLSA